MNDPYASDIIEIYGTPIQLSTVKEYRLRQIEYVLRPLYAEREGSKWGRPFHGANKHRIEFVKMDYYAAIIGETKYRNATEEYKPINFLESIGKTAVEAVQGIADAVIGGNQSRRIKYRLLNSAGRVFTRVFDDIPAVLARVDGKTSDIHRNDELYHLLGEPIAPTIEMVPALEIITTTEPYIFFGKGIQLSNIENEYKKLRIAFEVERQARLEREKSQPNFLSDLFNRILPQPQQARSTTTTVVKIEAPECQTDANYNENESYKKENI